MSSTVVLVGRPNVGKSTLFNRLTKTREALVADLPGMTRDRQYGEVLVGKKTFTLVDTGGVGVEDEAIDALMAKQSRKALDEADIILFVVDGRAGLSGLDETIAQNLRKLNKPILVVVNKSEHLQEEMVLSDFQSLGFDEIFMISSAHGHGIAYFLDALAAHLEEAEENPEERDNGAIKITLVGRPNVGKSTLMNRILGEERVLVYDMPGTTRDSIYVPFERRGRPYILVDTAGIRRRARIKEQVETFSVVKTKEAIRNAHVCLMLIDAVEGITDQDLHLLGFIQDSGRALIICVNKWDGLSEAHKKSVKEELKRRLTFLPFATIRFISAQVGTGVSKLFQDIHKTYDAQMQTFSTTHLTNLLNEFIEKHPPPMINGRRIKPRYAHSGGENPPRIVIHGNQLPRLPDSYRRYLISSFMEALKLQGTPLKIEYKSGENPFKDKRNTLTPRQIVKKKRLMKHIKKKQ